MSEDDYYRALAEAECALAARCCARAGLRVRTRCEEEAERGVRTWRPDPSSGARFDPEAAAECVDAFAAIECVPAKVGRNDPPPCSRVYSHGHVPLGGRCANSWFECAPVVGEIVSCSPTSFSPRENTCLIYRERGEGERCVELERETHTAYQCIGLQICDDHDLCVQPAERGEPCITGPVYGDTCAAGSVCDRRGSKRCVEPAPIGSPCESSENLCESLACFGGRCREPLRDMLYCER